MIRYVILGIIATVQAGVVIEKAKQIKNEFTLKLLDSFSKIADLTFSDDATKEIHPGS